MSDRPPKPLPMPARLAILALLFMGGFVIPLLFVPAALLAWSLFDDLRNPPPKLPEWLELRWTVDATDPRWKEYFLKFCGSPEEETFLLAMIDAYQLTPREGLLEGTGLTLSLPENKLRFRGGRLANEPSFRVGFLVNGCLVIEFDGVAYQYSSKAIRIDRDDFVRGKGYTVLRIPAQVVLNDAPEAVRRVRAAIAEGRKPKDCLARENSSSAQTERRPKAAAPKSAHVVVRRTRAPAAAPRPSAVPEPRAPEVPAVTFEETPEDSLAKAVSEVAAAQMSVAASAEKPAVPRNAADKATAIESAISSQAEIEGYWDSLFSCVDEFAHRELPTSSGLRDENSSTIGTTVRIETEALPSQAEATASPPGDKQAIQAFADKIKIPCLVHFTRAANLPQILSHGLLPVDAAMRVGLAPHVNDNRRLDGHRNGTSLSVAFPNYRMFWRYRQENPDVDWVVLAIDSSLLWRKNCAFCRRNAADARISSQPVERLMTAAAFLGMFDEVEGLPSRREQNLKAFDPTDEQAEVLVFDVIAPALIRKVVFESKRVRDAYQERLRGRVTEVHGPRQGFFAARSYVRRFTYGN